MLDKVVHEIIIAELKPNYISFTYLHGFRGKINALVYHWNSIVI